MPPSARQGPLQSLHPWPGGGPDVPACGGALSAECVRQSSCASHLDSATASAARASQAFLARRPRTATTTSATRAPATSRPSSHHTHGAGEEDDTGFADGVEAAAVGDGPAVAVWVGAAIAVRVGVGFAAVGFGVVGLSVVGLAAVGLTVVGLAVVGFGVGLLPRIASAP